jgi:hypothetical protein
MFGQTRERRTLVLVTVVAVIGIAVSLSAPAPRPAAAQDATIEALMARLVRAEERQATALESIERSLERCR